MKNLKTVLVALTSCAVLTWSTLSAAEASKPCGFYIEGNAGWSKLYGKSYSPGSQDNNGFAWNATGGYKIFPYAAVEGGVSSYANTIVNAPDGTRAGQDRHWSYDIAAKGIIPFGASGFELFGKLGISRIYSSVIISNETAANSINLESKRQFSNGLFAGAGAYYAITPALGVNVQWTQANGNSKTGSQGLLSAGLSWIVS